jgi:hypothetical protein
MTFTKVMHFDIIDLLLPEAENNIHANKTEKHMNYNARQAHVPQKKKWPHIIC